ncbi:MAG: RES family NAD+ phosphorylase [Nitrincola sp.]|nr:RES family NAD+ phosphorylase [Nitrincola sp.]
MKNAFSLSSFAWGSRFGRTHEPSLFYGGKTCKQPCLSLPTIGLFFYIQLEGEPPKASLRTEHTLFSAGYRSNRGIKLQERPFFDYKMQLSHMNNYDISQALGSEMRACGVQVFEYFSARSKNDEVCVALFTPEAFADAKPSAVEAWFCELTSDQVSFKPQRSNMTYSFGLAQFLVDDRLPMPA